MTAIYSRSLIRQLRCNINRMSASVVLVRPSNVAWYSAEALRQPEPDGPAKTYPPKLQNIVDEVSKLTLLEVAELNELLKCTLKIPDAPMMSFGAVGAPGASATEDEDKPEKIVKTSFTVKLVKFDDTKKVPLIKEIKTQIPGMNLVQAKKFVESVPQVVRGDIGKEEAEKLVDSLKAAGGICEVE